MIESKADYRFYLEADRVAHCQTRRWPRPFVDDTWRFQRLLRKVEYYTNCKRSAFGRAYARFLYVRLHVMELRLGFIVFRIVFGPEIAILYLAYVMVRPIA